MPLSLDSLKGIEFMSLQIRVNGLLLIGLSIAEFAAGGAAFGFLSKRNSGAWWGAVLAFLTGVLSQYFDRLSISFITILAFLAGVACFGGMFYDGFVADAIRLSGCYSTSNVNQTYGKSDSFPGVYNCTYVASADCICLVNDKCSAFYLSEGSDCETLYSTYYGELVASSVINSVLGILSGFQFLFCYTNQAHRPNLRPEKGVTTYVLPPSDSVVNNGNYVPLQTDPAPDRAAVPTASLPSPTATLYPLSYAPVPVSYAPVNTDQQHLQQQVLSDGVVAESMVHVEEPVGEV